MKPHRTRSDIKREAIINAAKQAFQTYGVNGTTMDKLAQVAQVSKRTVYNHFCTKEELVMYLIRELWSKTMLSVAASYSSVQPLQQQLQALLRIEIDLFTGDEYLELARVAFGHFFYKTDKLRDEICQFTAQETVLHKWLKCAQDDGRLVMDDLQASIKELGCLVRGHCFWPQLLKLEPPLSEEAKQRVAERTAALFLSHYAVERPE
ncbi:TetR/AcrR family transcriptional regulator [Alteromonas aestuariivivens]|uniref:TetR/AcrR family transcriptional regulator n=1 Tax=Alteromonas aestuariivivens TaxID=1938339 RepID=A0A3D8M3P4_9ALTE|nr:TetR/AcrR family transcriptional regulator [Alteromonas aestuariivivens]RDV24238.1 TetR/AcrR family transcriptional regulator [Alteromonas aestuariivivens]